MSQNQPTPRARATKPGGPDASPEDAKALVRAAVQFSALVIASMLAAALPLPWLVLAPIVCVATLVMGVRTALAARRARARGSLYALLAAGGAITGFYLVGTASLLMFWPVTLERQQCLDRALTNAAQERCEAQYQDSLEGYLERVTNRISGG